MPDIVVYKTDDPEISEVLIKHMGITFVFRYDSQYSDKLFPQWINLWERKWYA